MHSTSCLVVRQAFEKPPFRASVPLLGCRVYGRGISMLPWQGASIQVANMQYAFSGLMVWVLGRIKFA